MELRRVLGAAVLMGALGSWAGAQEGRSRTVGAGDWPSHNFDLHGSRFSPLTEINVSNAPKLKMRWSFDHEGLAEQTPIVVNGVMFLGLGSKVIALNAATGATLWTTDVPPTAAGGRRGPAFGEGKIYSYSGG